MVVMSPTGPTAQQIELFRAVEDIHELTEAIVVLLTDRAGTAIAVAGDEDDFPPSLRALLAADKLAAAGSVRALLEPIAEELGGCPLNFTILRVEPAHVLTIAFDVSADLDKVQTVGREGADMIAEVLSAS